MSFSKVSMVGIQHLKSTVFGKEPSPEQKFSEKISEKLGEWGENTMLRHSANFQKWV